MLKSPKSKIALPSIEEIAASLTVEIKSQKLTPQNMNAFLKHVKDVKDAEKEAKEKGGPESQKVIISFKDYVRDHVYDNKNNDKDNVVIVPDFSHLTIGETVEYDEVALREALKQDEDKQDKSAVLENMKAVIDSKKAQNLDLSGLDFTGCRMVGAVFESCDLTGADIRDADLSGVVFSECVATGLDIRGSNISGLEFKESNLQRALDEIDEIKETSITILAEYDYSKRYTDMHFSTSESMLHRYKEDNQRLESEAKKSFETKNKRDLLVKNLGMKVAKKTIADSYAKLSWYDITVGGTTAYQAYSDIKRECDEKIEGLEDEIRAIEGKKFDQAEQDKIKYVVHPSVIENLLLVSESVRNKYDPAYERGSSKEKVQGVNQYVRLTREDVEDYLKSCVDRPNLSINDFAKEKMFSQKGKNLSGARVIADFSVHIDEADKNASYAGIVTNLSGLDFSNRDLGGACFVGANVQDCKFVGAKLDNATFEGADASRANFTGASARDANFKAAKIQSATIERADFTRAYMPYARVYDLARDQGGVKAGGAEKLRISENSRFNFADLSNANLDEAIIKNSEFDYADLSGVSLANADIQRCKMRHANLERAILNNCTMVESDLTGSILRDVEARKIGLKGVILENVDAKNIDLTEAEIDEFCKMPGANLESAIMCKIKAEGVNFYNANMQSVDLELAQLSGAIVENVNLRFANLEGVTAHGIKAAGVDMTGANLTDIKAKGANFTKAQLEGVIAHRADLENAVLENANLRGIQMRDAILVGVKAKEVDLRNADLTRGDLREGELYGAVINDGSNFQSSKGEKEAKGEFQHENADGTRRAVPVKEAVDRGGKVKAAENRSGIAKWLAKPAQAIGGDAKRAGAFIKQPISKKWGRIIGAVVGVALVSTFVVGTVLSAGLTIPVAAAAIGGSLVAAGGVGAVAGHFIAKKITILPLLGGAAGFSVAGPVGGVVGGVGVAVAENFIEKATGINASKAIGDGIERAGEAIRSLGDDILKGEELLKAQEASKASYEAIRAAKITEAEKIKPVFDIAKYKINRQAAFEDSKENTKDDSPNSPSPEQRGEVWERAKSVGGKMHKKMENPAPRPRAKSQSNSKSKGPEVG